MITVPDVETSSDGIAELHRQIAILVYAAPIRMMGTKYRATIRNNWNAICTVRHTYSTHSKANKWLHQISWSTSPPRGNDRQWSGDWPQTNQITCSGLHWVGNIKARTIQTTFLFSLWKNVCMLVFSHVSETQMCFPMTNIRQNYFVICQTRATL